MELYPVDGLQRLSADDLLELTETQLNGIADYRLVVDSDQLQALNDQIDRAMQAVEKRKAFEAVSQNITITAVRNTSDDDFTDANAAVLPECRMELPRVAVPMRVGEQVCNCALPTTMA